MGSVGEEGEKGIGLTYVLVLVVFGGEGVTKRRSNEERERDNKCVGYRVLNAEREGYAGERGRKEMECRYGWVERVNENGRRKRRKSE